MPLQDGAKLNVLAGTHAMQRTMLLLHALFVLRHNIG